MHLESAISLTRETTAPVFFACFAGHSFANLAVKAVKRKDRKGMPQKAQRRQTASLDGESAGSAVARERPR